MPKPAKISRTRRSTGSAPGTSAEPKRNPDRAKKAHLDDRTCREGNVGIGRHFPVRCRLRERRRASGKKGLGSTAPHGRSRKPPSWCSGRTQRRQADGSCCRCRNEAPTASFPQSTCFRRASQSDARIEQAPPRSLLVVLASVPYAAGGPTASRARGSSGRRRRRAGSP